MASKKDNKNTDSPLLTPFMFFAPEKGELAGNDVNDHAGMGSRQEMTPRA